MAKNPCALGAGLNCHPAEQDNFLPLPYGKDNRRFVVLAS